jgi:hypothetical protein
MSPSDAAKRFRETADTYLDMIRYVSDERKRRILQDLFEENEAKAELLERVLIQSARRDMAYEAILKRIRLLIPAEREGYYQAVRRGFEEGELTAPILSISDIQLARAI